jgi:hypothetical protein
MQKIGCWLITADLPDQQNEKIIDPHAGRRSMAKWTERLKV